MERLDDFVTPLLSEHERLAVKIDTQGHEDEVLAGAEGILDRVDLLIVELSLKPLYEGQRLVGDLLPLLQERGFLPVIIEPCDKDMTTYEIFQVDVWLRSLSATKRALG